MNNFLKPSHKLELSFGVSDDEFAICAGVFDDGDIGEPKLLAMFGGLVFLPVFGVLVVFLIAPGITVAFGSISSLSGSLSSSSKVCSTFSYPGLRRGRLLVTYSKPGVAKLAESAEPASLLVCSDDCGDCKLLDACSLDWDLFLDVLACEVLLVLCGVSYDDLDELPFKLLLAPVTFSMSFVDCRSRLKVGCCSGDDC